MKTGVLWTFFALILALACAFADHLKTEGPSEVDLPAVTDGWVQTQVGVVPS